MNVTRGICYLGAKLKTAIIAAGLSLLLSACAYKTETSVAPANNVVTSFSSKLSGKWLLRTDAERLRETIRSSDMNCAVHTYPLDFAAGFPASLRGTLANVVERIEDAGDTTPADRSGKLGARGIISARGENLRGQFRVVPGFWSANVVAEIDISVALTADGPNGRLFGKTIDGRGRSEAELGAFCAGAAIAVQKAADEAQRDALRRIGEEIGNADRLRNAR